MTTVVPLERLVEDLSARYPEDTEDLQDALQVLKKQKIVTCDRLAKLGDSQWQRLGLPMGIEALLREEVVSMQQAHAPAQAPPAAPAASSSAPAFQASTRAHAHAPAPPSAASTSHVMVDQYGELPLEPYDDDDDDDDYLPSQSEGLHQRRGAGGSRGSQRMSGARRGASAGGRGSEKRGMLAPMDLTPPADLDQLWQQLLDDTLPPDKRAALQESWETAGDEHDRYMMFLEYSSYLRKPEVTEEEKAERKKQMEPLMRELGLRMDEEDLGGHGAILWWLLLALVFFIAGLVYYAYSSPDPDPLHDLQSL